MNVKVQLLSYLVNYTSVKEKTVNLELKPGANIGELLSLLEIPAKVSKVVLVNGYQAKGESPLTEGDEVIIFPPTAGG